MKTVRVSSNQPQSFAKTPNPITYSQINGYEVIEFDDKSKQINLEKIIAKFRSPTGKEAISAINSGKNNNAHQNRILATKCCIRWGDSGKVSLNDLSSIRLAEHYAISRLLESFVQEAPFQLIQNDDYSISLVFDKDDFSCTFRDLKGEEADFIESTFDKFSVEKVPTLEAFGKIATKLCTSWGEESTVTESDILSRPVSTLIAVGRAITENFLQRS